jgi:hypothetical protein
MCVIVSISEESNNVFQTQTSRSFRSFTTERKTSINILRKGSIVKERCRQLAETALSRFPDRRISDEDLNDLIEDFIGADKETVRAYKGYYGRIKYGRSGEGHVIGLSRKGYLERFGFMHRSGRTYVIHAQVKLPTGPIPYQDNEESSVFKENISISFSQGKEREKTDLRRLSRYMTGGEIVRGERKKKKIQREIEIFLQRLCFQAYLICLD